jgi:two-component system CheB/CheR fusion protein
MLGLNYEDFTHFKDFMNIVHPDDYENAMDAMRMHLDGKTDKYECQYRLRNSEGNYQWFQDIGKIAFQTEEKTIVSGIVIEFTTRKQTDLQLLESMKKAETANIYKNQFLANMSHEIRTPLNGLVGFAQLLRNESLDVETKNMYIDVIESSSKILLNLINDIMDISKIEAGELKMNMSNCDLQSMFLELKTTFDTLKNKNGKDNVEIIVSIPEALKGMVIKTDPARLKQVLTNLLDNSLKFTESGKVELGYAVKKNKVVFKVSDTGIGMSKDNLDIIFERFQQLEHSDKAKYTGTGLGLAISKGIINLMGGSINVESEELKGSVFTFDILYLPAGSDSELITGSDMQNIELFRDKKILIAEDDHYNRIYIKELLKDIPLNIFWAENGVEAVEKFKQNKEISLILMDIRMPLLDGYKAAKQILEYKPDALIIAQTAYAISSEKEKCIENGFVDRALCLKKAQELCDIRFKKVSDMKQMVIE